MQTRRLSGVNGPSLPAKADAHDSSTDPHWLHLLGLQCGWGPQGAGPLPQPCSQGLCAAVWRAQRACFTSPRGLGQRRRHLYKGKGSTKDCGPSSEDPPIPQGPSLQPLQRSMALPTPAPIPHSSTTTQPPEPPLTRAPRGMQESLALRCPACYSGGGRENIGTWCHEPLNP